MLRIWPTICLSFSPDTCWSLNRFICQSRLTGKKMVHLVLWCQTRLGWGTSRKSHMSCLITKTTKWLRPAKTQISLGIQSTQSDQSLLCAQWVAKDTNFLHSDSEDWSDWVDAQADLSLCWAHMPFCLFCYEEAHIYCNTSLQTSNTLKKTSLCHMWTAKKQVTDQRLCSLLPRSYNILIVEHYIRNFQNLASFCSWADWFESYLVANLRRWPIWSDSSLGSHAILLVFSSHGLNNKWTWSLLRLHNDYVLGFS